MNGNKKVMKFDIIKGDLIKLALKGNFDVITHGCNCMSAMGAGIAPQMARAFGADKFKMEIESTGIKKLGNIDFKKLTILENGTGVVDYHDNWVGQTIYVVNSYTQEFPGKPNKKYGIPLDYDALILCMRKINKTFGGLHIGLPWIGCGLAGGDKNEVEYILKEELIDMDVTIVEYQP